MAYKKKTRFRVPGRAGGMTILRKYPEKNEKGKNIYFSNLGRKGALKTLSLYGTQPDTSGQSTGMYPCR